MTEAEPTPRRAGADRPARRQAVILIHGIGEQRPMATLRGFVDTVLRQSGSDSQADAKYYSKPDLLSDTLELRRLVSAGGRDHRTDFYEYYWAHLLPTAAWNRLASWYFMLMYRKPQDVPKRFRLAWGASWVVLAFVVLAGLWSVGRYLLGYPIADWVKLPWLLAVLLGIAGTTFRSYVGDAAVYLSPTPANIEARQKIRATGLTLLERIASSGRYDRIIVVGHSLGSVIGYDVLTFAWQRSVEEQRSNLTALWQTGQLPQIENAAVREAEALTKEIRNSDTTDRGKLGEQARGWKTATRNVADEMMRNGQNWLVSDFVTLGSPLTHGDLLLAANRADFERRARERELPHCPPVRELNGRFSFQHSGRDHLGRAQKAWVLNHAAVFAATAWTNIYFPNSLLLKGDVVGGPCAPVFWAGVQDVEVSTKRWGGWLAHTRYWDRDPRDLTSETNPADALRVALDLERSGFPRPRQSPQNGAG